MRFDGTDWVNVGSTGFSKGEAQYIQLAFSPSGQPFVAYKDDENSYKATVMKFVTLSPIQTHKLTSIVQMKLIFYYTCDTITNYLIK